MLNSCASYRFGTGERTLPPGVKTVAIPQFKNRTMETGVENYFTNAMRDQFHRHPVGRITSPEYADAIIQGTIIGVNYTPGAKQTSGSSGQFLPQQSVLAAEYRVLVTCEVKVIQRSDNKVLWGGTFTGENTYAAPQVTLTGLNTVNPLYNLSARRSNIHTIATQITEEAFNRMTESF